MKWHKIFFFTFFLASCTNKPVRQIYEELQSAPQSQVMTYEKIDFAKLANSTQPGQISSVTLEPTDSILIDTTGRKSHFKVFRLPDVNAFKHIEIHSLPYRPAGFGGEFRLVDPEMVFFDAKGKKIRPQPTETMRVMTSTFVDGKYLRTVWSIPTGSKPSYAVLTAKTNRIGQNAMSVTQYGAAVAGVIYDQTVIFSPTGWVRIFPTAMLKK